MSWQLRLRLLRFFHWLSLSLVAQLVSVDSGQPQTEKPTSKSGRWEKGAKFE
jgi:hypothetical protein